MKFLNKKQFISTPYGQVFDLLNGEAMPPNAQDVSVLYNNEWILCYHVIPPNKPGKLVSHSLCWYIGEDVVIDGQNARDKKIPMERGSKWKRALPPLHIPTYVLDRQVRALTGI